MIIRLSIGGFTKLTIQPLLQFLGGETITRSVTVSQPIPVCRRDVLEQRLLARLALEPVIAELRI